jgi:AcrR family transcriptional regulator
MDMDVRLLRPREIRRATISMEIELATLRLAVKHGLENVTVEQIADAAGISRRTFYRYFDTIDDIVCEMPRRALRRLSNAVTARPSSETVIEAFVNVVNDLSYTNEESEVQRLGFQVARQSPTAWWRAMARVETYTNESYQRMIADRLRISGEDPAHGPLVAAVMIAIVGHLARESVQKGVRGLDPRRLADALKALITVMAAAPLT